MHLLVFTAETYDSYIFIHSNFNSPEKQTDYALRFIIFFILKKLVFLGSSDESPRNDVFLSFFHIPSIVIYVFWLHKFAIYPIF